ncbi:DNA repair protein rad52 [Myotisia sp. PD_48]|nr:DNA repair protein rad52 [Myotisia sp. PD_48]
MPAPGDQHRVGQGRNTLTTFPTPSTCTSDYTPEEIATIQGQLEKQLGPEFISTRPGAGGQRLQYITADKCINLANEIFGFNGWSSSIQNMQVDFVKENPDTGKVTLGISVIVRVTLRDGTYHEDVGYGQAENAKGQAAAYEKAKKEGATDALKRALRTFGNVLGNCIYDKDYLSKISKMRAVPTNWDVEKLHRHPDFAPKIPVPDNPPRILKQEPKAADPPNLPQRVPRISNQPTDESLGLEFDGEFGSDMLDEVDFGEHSAFPSGGGMSEGYGRQQQSRAQGTSNHPPLKNGTTTGTADPNTLTTPSKPPKSLAAGPITRNRSTNPPVPGDRGVKLNINPPDQYKTPAPKPSGSAQPLQPTAQGRPINPPQPPLNTSEQAKSSPDHLINDNKPQEEEKVAEDPVGGFYSAKALLSKAPLDVKSAPVFDPNFQSPSIRKTAGIDHNSSSPIVRQSLQRMQATNAPSTNTIKPNPYSNASGMAGGVSNLPGNGAATNITNNPISGPPGKPSISTAYRPPTRRGPMSSPNNPNGNANTLTGAIPNVSNAGAIPGKPSYSTAYNNGNGTHSNQNLHGKRPPLTDATNVPPARLGENDPDAAKKARIGDTTTPHLGVQAQPHQKQSNTGPPGNVK